MPVVRVLILATFALMTLPPAAASAAQSDCAECQPIASRLKFMEGELKVANGRVTELQARVAELENSGTQFARESLAKVRRQLELARNDVVRVELVIAQLSMQLRECRRQCQLRQDRPHRSGDLVDESIPRAACKECQPLVDRIKDLQRLRRIVRDQLKEVRAELAAHSARGQSPDPDFDGVRWFGEGMGLVVDEAALVRGIAELTAQIEAALIELTACNWRCSGQTPPESQTAAGRPPVTTTPTPAGPPVCRPCLDAAEELAAAERLRDVTREELEELELHTGALRARHEMNVSRLRELTGKGEGDGSEARRLKEEISRHVMFNNDHSFLNASLKELKAKLAELDKEIPALRKALEECQKECKPKQTSGILKRPLPYAAGAAVAVASVLVGGGNSTTAPTGTIPPAPDASVTGPTTTPTPAPPPQPQPQPQPPPAPVPPVEFNVTVSPTVNHPGGSTSRVCGLVITSPAQPGAAFLVTLNGPGVVQGQSTGTLNSNGRGAFQNTINLFGSYTVNVSVTSSGVTRTGSASVNVNSSNFNCPAA